jgi:hypothetical protein
MGATYLFPGGRALKLFKNGVNLTTFSASLLEVKKNVS